MKLQATKLSSRAEMYPNGVCISSEKFNIMIDVEIAYQMVNINDYDSLNTTTIPQLYSLEVINRVRELYGKTPLIYIDPMLSKLANDLNYERHIINKALRAMREGGGLDDMDGVYEAESILKNSQK